MRTWGRWIKWRWKKTSDEGSNEIIDHSVERLICNLNGLNGESEQLIDEIEHISMREEKLDDIRDEDMYYDG